MSEVTAEIMCPICAYTETEIIPVDRCLKGAGSPAVPIEHKLGVLWVVDWAERHANSLDPLTDIAGVILQFDNRS